MAYTDVDVAPRPGTRAADLVQAREAFLRTGKVPAGYLLRQGVTSLVADPWLLVVRHMPGHFGYALRKRYFRWRLGSCGRGLLVDPGAYILNPENTYLGDFCYVGTGAQLVAPEGYIRVGRRCHITARILGHGGVEIGNYVGAAGSILSVSESYQGGYRMAGPMLPTSQRRLRYGKIVIGDDAFLAAGSVVLPGVTVGEGAVVGPNTLVAASVPPWTVVLGTPAQTIGKRPPVTVSEAELE